MYDIWGRVKGFTRWCHQHFCLCSVRMDVKEPEELGSPQPVTIQAFASGSTLHGIAHIFSYERFSCRRMLWILCFLGSLSLLLFVCTERIIYYFDYPHVTKLDEISAVRMTFPAVTFCNLNEFRFSRVTKNDLYHAGELLSLLNNRWEYLHKTHETFCLCIYFYSSFYSLIHSLFYSSSYLAHAVVKQ